KSVSPKRIFSVPAALLTSTLLRSMNVIGEELRPVVTLRVHTPILPKKVTQPASGQMSPGPPSKTVTAGLMPSFRFNVATADAGVGPVTRAAQPSITARPTAITALVIFINPP